MPLSRKKEIRSQSRGFLKAISCLLEIITLKISQQQHQHIVKKHEEMFDSAFFITHSCGGGGVREERQDGKLLFQKVIHT